MNHRARFLSWLVLPIVVAIAATVATNHSLRLQQRHKPRLVKWWRQPAICLHKHLWYDAFQWHRPLCRCWRVGTVLLRRGELS